MDQIAIDETNAAFWTELCGTGLAKQLEIIDHSPESLRRFDEAYFGIYPYLKQYVGEEVVSGRRVLEVGLGYGTLSQFLIESGADYHGLDISHGPVEMVRGRMRVIGRGTEAQVVQGSALEIPHEDGSLDTVVSIGCLHHTGDLLNSIEEVARVLKPGGTAVIMIYNAWSLRQLLFRLAHPSIWFRGEKAAQKLRAKYDANAAGEAAPHTDYTSPPQLKRVFRSFSTLRYNIQNMDPLKYRRDRYVPREKLLNNLGRIVGLDLYVTASK